MAFLGHARRVDLQDDRFPSATSDLKGGVAIGREMHVVALSWIEPLGEDAVEESFDRAMVKCAWRRGRGQTEIDLNGMALIGPNSAFVFGKGETLLVVTLNESFELRPGQRVSRGGQPLEQGVDLDPAAVIELDPGGLRLMAKHQREKAASLGHSSIQILFPRTQLA